MKCPVCKAKVVVLKRESGFIRICESLEDCIYVQKIAEPEDDDRVLVPIQQDLAPVVVPRKPYWQRP